MAINTGTLITAAIRPNDSLDLIASAFSNEIMGGHHMYQTISERDLIITARREWGMLVTTYNDATASNNKTYQLKYNYIDTDITNNNNWIQFSGGGNTGNGTSEWTDSSISRYNDPSTLTQSLTGDRYLITTGVGVWNGYNDNIAQWDNNTTSWAFTQPTDGMSMRIDNEDNSIYRYEGTYSSGIWVKELTTQIRYITPTSSNGLSYSYNGMLPTISGYTNSMVFYANFATANSGTVSLNINGLGNVIIKKIVSGTSSYLSSNDIVPDIIYQLLYDGNYFQTTMPSSATTIGPAEFGLTYSDGLYTDFVTSTPIGTPIDRFNHILKALVPPSAPVLNSWSAVITSVSGKLSFDNVNPISGSNYITATSSPYGSVSVDGSFNVSNPYRLGIISNTGAYWNNITGTLNSAVAAHTSTPTPAYIINSFGDAIIGTISMIINGVTSSSIGLSSTYSAIDTTSGGSQTGINVTAATSSKFPTGYPFETFYNRTGSWLVNKNDLTGNFTYSNPNNGLMTNSKNFTQGYNYIIIRHDKPTTSIILNRYEFVLDDNSTSTTFASPSIGTITLTGSKNLSGIRYYTGGYIKYSGLVQNIYRNTYYQGSDAVVFNDTSTPSINGVYGVYNTNTNSPIFTAPNSYYPASLGNETSPYTISGWTLSIVSSGIRRINDSISTNLTAKRTVQGTITGGAASSANYFIDNVSNTSTDILENFDDENYRLINPTTQYTGSQYDLSSSILSNIWTSSTSLVGNIGSPDGKNNGLQIINSHLIYPRFNYNTIGSLSTNLNFGSGVTVDYSTSTSTLLTGVGGAGSRTYTRYFKNNGLSTANFVIVINGGGGTFVPVSTALTGNNIWVEIKSPGSGLGSSQPSGAVTGWMDAYGDYVAGSYNDGSGARAGNTSGYGITTGRAFGANWGITIGNYSTYYSSGYMLLRITVGPSFVGYFNSISWAFVT